MLKHNNRGFTLIELILVVAIIGIIVSLVIAVGANSRDKAADARIRNDVGQLRWLAELVYTTQNNSFENWSTHPDIVNDLANLKADIDDAYGSANVTIIRDSEIQEYCVSAPLKSAAADYYCIDAAAVYITTNNPCPAVAPFQCQ